MALYVREFELFEEDGMVAALPFGLEGATCGNDFDDALDMAADWLYETTKMMLINGKEPESGHVGNEPQHGGKVIAVAVSCDLDNVPAMTAADAARALDVSPARISQMCDSGQLISWKDGSKRLILKESVEARLKNQPKPGRPKKALVMA